MPALEALRYPLNICYHAKQSPFCGTQDISCIKAAGLSCEVLDIALPKNWHLSLRLSWATVRRYR